MENPTSPPPVAGRPIATSLISTLETLEAFPVDSPAQEARGVGKCGENCLPHLLENNFNRVLLVDEDAEVHVSINRALTSSGCRVQHAISEIDAVQLIKDCSPDFLIINWKKSIPSNVPFYESLRHANLDRYLYIIVMTTVDLVSNKAEMIASGADAFVVKPVKPGELLLLLQAGVRIIQQQLRLRQGSMNEKGVFHS